MSEIPIFTLAIANYISTKDHLERAGSNSEDLIVIQLSVLGLLSSRFSKMYR